jgi:hypothetical protein
LEWKARENIVSKFAFQMGRNLCARYTPVQACGGLAYSFSVYSEDLRGIYPKQSDVDLLGTMKDVGAYFGVVGGLLYDYGGPQATLLAGALMHFFGYVGVWGVLTRRFVNPPLWQTSIIIAVAANGNSFFDTAALLTSMHNFPMEKGTVAGLLKSYLGLSSALFAQLYDAFVPEHMKHRAAAFVLLCAVGGGAVAVLMTPLMIKYDGGGSGEGGSGNGGGGSAGAGSGTGGGTGGAAYRAAQFRRLTGAVAALVAWVVLAATLNDPQVIGMELPSWINFVLTGGMLLVLLSPWGLLAASGALGLGRRRSAKKSEDEDESQRSNGRNIRRRRRERYESVDGVDDATDVERSSSSLLAGLLGHGERAAAESDVDVDDELAASVFSFLGGAGDDEDNENLRRGGDTSHHVDDELARRPHHGDEEEDVPPPLKGQSTASLTLTASLRSAEFWLLFATLSVSSGAAMTLVNNMDAIAAAAGSPASTASALVSLFSVCNCIG